MSGPYVPAVFVPGQQNQQPNNGQPPPPTQAFFAGPPSQNHTVAQSAYHAQAYAPGQSLPAAVAQPYAPGQPPQPVAALPYVPGQSTAARPAMHQSAPVYGRAQIPGQAAGYSAHAPPQQGEAHAPVQAVPDYAAPQEQYGAYDPNDPNDERGLLATGGKIALGVGAAMVAYNAYNQFQQHHNNPQPPPQLSYGDVQQSAYGSGVAQPTFEQLQRRGVLTIYLDRLTNLANKDLLSKSDPYVKLSIEQDNWIRDIDHGEQRSTCKNDDLNPVYNEIFHFNLPTLQNMVLKVKVMDDDGGLTSDDKMGSVKVKLWELGLSNFPMQVERTIDRKVFGADSKCHLRLAYSG